MSFSYHSTRLQIPEGLNIQLFHRENLKFLIHGTLTAWNISSYWSVFLKCGLWWQCCVLKLLSGPGGPWWRLGGTQSLCGHSRNDNVCAYPKSIPRVFGKSTGVEAANRAENQTQNHPSMELQLIPRGRTLFWTSQNACFAEMLTFVFRSACNNRACYHLAASFGCTASSGIQWGNKAAAIAHTIITQGSAHLAVSNLSRMIGAFMLFKGFSHFHANMDLPKRTKKKY